MSCDLRALGVFLFPVTQALCGCDAFTDSSKKKKGILKVAELCVQFPVAARL